MSDSPGTPLPDDVHPYAFPDEWFWRKEHGDGSASGGVRAFDTPDFSRLPESALKDRLTFDRLILSLRDFAHARSAITFIEEEIGDEGERYSLAELRKFTCYETTLIVAYARPFSESKGLPRLSFQHLAVKLSPFNRALHEEMMSLRNKVFAHSDDEHIPRSSGWAMKGTPHGGGAPFTAFVPPRFQEGTLLSYAKVQQVSVMVSSIVAAVVHRLQAMHVHFLDEIPVREMLSGDGE